MKDFKHKVTRSYIRKVQDYLTTKYKQVQPEWLICIQLLGDNLDLYFDCQAEIDKDGIFDSQTYRKNPLIATLKDLQATILKEIQHLGISPYADSRLKIEAADDSVDFISSLTEGGEDDD